MSKADISDIIIRRMNTEDYDEVSRLWSGIKGLGIRSIDDSREGVERFIMRNPSTSVVAQKEDGSIVGSILCGHDGRQACFYHVCVQEDYRKRGIGRALVGRAVEALKEERVSRIYLIAFKNNEVGNVFWSKVGWQRRDNRNYYELFLNENDKTVINV